MNIHAERIADQNLRTFSVPPRNRKGPSKFETVVAMVIGFGGIAFVVASAYNLFIG